MQTGEERQAHSGSAFEIVYNPRRAAEAAARRGAWFPLLVLAVAGGAADYPMLSRFGATGLIDARLQQTPSGLSSLQVLFFIASQYAAPVLLPIAAWIAGLFLSSYVVFVLDARVKRRQVVAVTAWAFLPAAFERLLSGAFRWFRLNPDANPFNPVASNLGFFLDPTSVRPFWYSLASGVDVFSLWTVVLAAVALGSLSRKPASSVFPAVVFAWVVGGLLKSAILG